MTIHRDMYNKREEKVHIFKPVNRHLLVEEIGKAKETEHNILLPDDYKPQQSQYVTVRVVEMANDVSLSHIVVGSVIVVERSMIKEIECMQKSLSLILENYVLGRVWDGLDFEEA